MPLPDLIEIVPLENPVRAEITVPGSKSITNRALVAAALVDGETVLKGALWSEDTQVMVECLQELGYMANVAPDPQEPCNRTITVYGQGGSVPRGGTPAQPLELFVGNAGTVARFLTAMVCLGQGVYRLHGVPRMHERPQAALFQALRELGYRIDSPNDRLPALVHGAGPKPGATCAVSIEESSQFASALLLCPKAGGWRITITGENAEESPYVEMTRKLVEAFPPHGGTFTVEPDASSGSYFWAADWILWSSGVNPETEMVTVWNWPTSGWQMDAAYPSYYSTISAPEKLSRKFNLGDSIMMAIAKAPLNRPAIHPSGTPQEVCPAKISAAAESTREYPIIFTDLGRLRVQECERVYALKTELQKCGVHVVEKNDTLEVYPGIQSPSEPIETYHDHRMAMCFGILGLKVPGIRIKNPTCVKKTFPNFFQKLAEPPPHGLGAIVRDAITGRRLMVEELFAQ